MNCRPVAPNSPLLSGIPEAITKREARQILHCSRQTLDRYIKQGKIRAYRISSRKIIVSASDIRALFSLDGEERDDES